MATADDILVLDGVTRRFGGFLLDGISFRLRPGSVMGLLGPNGAGKTTTIKLILNLLHLDAGSISVFGLDSRRDELAIKRKLGYLGERAILPPQGDALWLGRFLAVCFPEWDDRRYRHYLKRFGVPTAKPAGTLSKGTRTKLALAAAMGHRPGLLLMDEPTTGLDPLVRHEVVEAIREVAGDGRRAVLFSTHIVSDLEAAADAVTILDQGQVIASEAKDRLLGRWPGLSLEEVFRRLVKTSSIEEESSS